MNRTVLIVSTLLITLALAPMLLTSKIYSRVSFGVTSLRNLSVMSSASSPTSTSFTPRPIIPPRVVVVGSGLAGLSAAYTALQRGASVHLLDRAPKPGGNSIKASSGINGAGTRFQEPGTDSAELFYSDSVKSAGRRFELDETLVDRAALVGKLTAQSAEAVTWLVDEIGIDLSIVAALGAHSATRTHRGPKLPPGFAIVSGLLNKLKANENFTLTSNAEVTQLLFDGDAGASAVRGVQYTHEEGEHAAEGEVVFAAGGFAGDAALLEEYTPEIASLPSTNDIRPGAHSLLTAAGAKLLDMDSVQVHPTGFVNPAEPDVRLKFLAGEMLRGEGGILLNSAGERFVNELATRAAVSKVIMDLPPTEDSIRQWNITMIIDPGAAAAAASHISFYEFKGLLKKVQVADLPEPVVAAIDEHAAAVEESKRTGVVDDKLGRKTYGHWSLPSGEANRAESVYVGQITPVTHFTMGGVAIDTEARVLRQQDEDGGAVEAIPGLWAAGEITGGVHGDNRLGGSSLLECVVFGRTAGGGAANAAVSAAAGGAVAASEEE